jgi:hypothetical protein
MASNSEFTLTKREIAEHFDLAIQRLMKNKTENWKFIVKLKAIKAMVMFEDAAKFPYYWTVINGIFDSINAAIVLKRDGESNPNIAKLAEIQKQKVVENILAAPPNTKSLSEVIREKLQHGAMKDA